MTTKTDKPKLTDAQRKKKREDDYAARKAKLDKMSDTERAAFILNEKTANFKKIASRRLSNVIRGVRNLSKLAGNNYRYTEEQIQKIEDSLNTEVDNMLARFRTVKAPKEEVKVEL